MDRFYYKDTFVAVRNCTFRSRNHEDGKTCWCCESEFQEDDECVILINNYCHIPNMLLHKKCFKNHTQNNNNNIDRLCSSIKKDYIEYKKMSKVFN